MQFVRRFIAKYIHNHYLAIEARVTNAVVIFGIFSALLALIVRIVEQSSTIVIAFMVVIILILIIGFLLINRFDIYRYAIPLTLVVLGDIIFPFLFFTHGGASSGMAIFFLIPVFALFMIVHGWRRIAMLFLQGLVVIFCFGVAMQDNPIIPIVEISPHQSFVDTIVSWVVTGGFIGLVALYQRLIYDREKRRADEAIRSINHLNDLRRNLNVVATILLSANEKNKNEALEKSLALLAKCFAVDAIRIWRAVDETSQAFLLTLFECFNANDSKVKGDSITVSELPKIPAMEAFLKGETKHFYLSVDDPNIKERSKAPLRIFKMSSTTLIPIITNQEIWGFVSFASKDSAKRPDADEAEIMYSAVMILSASIVLQQSMNDLVFAREQALLGIKSRSDFLASMSHEIRTPISAIIGMTNLAMVESKVATEATRLQKIKEASNHLLGVINDILDMAKIESGKFKLQPRPFYARAMIDRTLSIIRFKAEERYQKLSQILDEELPERLIGDDLRIAQVIMNLLANAVKFTPDGGSIELRCNVLERSDKYCELEFLVIDDGIGIDIAQQNKLFNSFEQIDSGATRRYGGSGLGLSISKSIVESMGGSISVESNLGNGATFRFNIKLETFAQDDEALDDYGLDKEIIAFKELVEKRMLNLSKYRVLIVEDIDVNYEIVAAMLEPTLIKIDWARDGSEALELYIDDPERYDLILMDIQMPKMNGFDATLAIRKSDLINAKQIPILAMTANVLVDDIALCYKHGMNGHLGKPLDFFQLIGALKYHLKISLNT